MELYERKAVNDSLKKYDHLAKDSDFIEVTEWANGDGTYEYVAQFYNGGTWLDEVLEEGLNKLK